MPAGTTTPMMRQYQHLKQQYPDKILLFRMGDFFETFGEDAKTISRILNIALTSRDKRDDPTPLAGFPHHALNQYMPKIVAAGHHVVIANQVEDPKLAKGIVRREITRIVTPGTLTEGSESSENRNNYILSLFDEKQTYAIAICDISTGTFEITETRDRQDVRAEIERRKPSEILVPPSHDYSFLSDLPLQINEGYRYQPDESREVLTSHFNVRSLSAFGISHNKCAIIAAASLLSYLQETQRTDLPHLSTLTFFDLKGRMVLDAATIRNLDLVDTIGERGPRTTLLGVLNRTATGMGSRKLVSWILHPLLDVTPIQARLDAVDFYFNNPGVLSSTFDLLKAIADLERICGRVGLNRTNARDLLSLSSSLEQVLTLDSALSDTPAFTKHHRTITGVRSGLKSAMSMVQKSITDSPPLSITEGGIIREGFSKDIDSVREAAADSKLWIEHLEEAERKRTGISSLKVRMNKIFGYYIEVTHTHSEKVPDDYIRKQTLVNCERYITPELKEKEDIVLNAQEKLAQLEYESFQEVRQSILDHVEEIQTAADVVAEIDALASLAQVARQNDYCRPIIHESTEKEGMIQITDGRHPVVEQTIEEPFVPNDIHLDRKNERLIILTGPNMSGKSTFIRQTALIVLMAQIGSFVPARSAEISLVDRIFTRVGASDDLAAGRSTFMVEMDEAANIINNATQHSLIVLDELGRGTSTYDGVSIAWAIAEHIHNVIGARCLFATHYHELLKLESEMDAARNYNVGVLEENDTVIFLRKIEKGGTDRSYGIYVAQMAGLPGSVIDRASEILKGFEQENMFGVRNEPTRGKKEVGDRKDQGMGKTDGQEERSALPSSPQLSFIDSGSNPTVPTLFQELKSTDINNLTPIQALQLIEKWKRRVGK